MIYILYVYRDLESTNLKEFPKELFKLSNLKQL